MTKELIRTCPECGTEFNALGKQGKPRTFCSNPCKQAHANRRTVRGKALMTAAQAWRKSRGAGEFGKFLFGEVTAMIDHWNAEDLAAGRMDPVEYAKLSMNVHSVNPDYNGGRSFEADRWFDRQQR
jgi:endogenous inhibitor of DNA gyrase (YacG/DUF329 family)